MDANKPPQSPQVQQVRKDDKPAVIKVRVVEVPQRIQDQISFSLKTGKPPYLMPSPER